MVDKQYHNPDLGMVWMFATMNGDWCKVCFNVHRIAYKSKIGLGLFSNYLMATERRTLFMKYVIAYVTLENTRTSSTWH